MDKNEIKKKLKDEIKRERGLFFPDIEIFFKDNNYDFKGDRSIYLINDDGTPNYSQVVWINWSEEAVNIILEIINENKDEFYLRCSNNIIDILVSGGSLSLPISKNFNRTYKKPHWVPSSIEYNGGK